MTKPNFIVRDAYGVEIPGAAEEFQAILDKVQSDGPPKEGTVRKIRYISGIVIAESVERHQAGEITFASGKWYTSEEWAKEFPPPASPSADFDTGPLIAKAREHADEARNDPRGV